MVKEFPDGVKLTPQPIMLSEAEAENAPFDASIPAELDVALDKGELLWVVSNGGRVTALVIRPDGWFAYPASPSTPLRVVIDSGSRQRYRIETTGGYHNIFKDGRQLLQYYAPGTRQFLNSYPDHFSPEEQAIILRGGTFVKTISTEQASSEATLFGLRINRSFN